MNKKTILISLAVIVIIGLVLYFVVFRKKQQEQASTLGTNADAEEDPILNAEEDLDSIGENITDQTETGSSEPVSPKLDWVKQKKVAQYLTTLLQESQMDELRGWANLIDKEQAEDPNKWKENGGLSGQVSDVGHALYQMKVWNPTILENLKNAQE